MIVRNILFVFVLFSVFSALGCVKITTKVDSEKVNRELYYGEYGLPVISKNTIRSISNRFARADLARRIMSPGHFFGEEEVSNIFRRKMPRDIFILPYMESTLYAYSDKSNCFLLLMTDYINTDYKSSIKNIIRTNRFGRYLRNSLLYLPDRNADFLNVSAELGWRLVCFEPLARTGELRRIISAGKRVMSATEIVQIMLMSPNLLLERNVVSSDKIGKNSVIVSRAKNGRISIFSRNFSVASDVIALHIEYDRRRVKRYGFY